MLTSTSMYSTCESYIVITLSSVLIRSTCLVRSCKHAWDPEIYRLAAASYSPVLGGGEGDIRRGWSCFMCGGSFRANKCYKMYQRCHFSEAGNWRQTVRVRAKNSKQPLSNPEVHKRCQALTYTDDVASLECVLQPCPATGEPPRDRLVTFLVESRVTPID